MRTVFKILFSLVLITGLIVPASNVQAATNNITVTPASADWAFLVETAGTNSGSFVSGPGTPPVGSGSLRFTVDSAAGLAFITQKYQGTLLADIDTLSYSTYVTTGSGSTAPTFQFNYDPDLTSVVDPKPWYGRLVYEPYMNGTVTNGTWQTWDMLAGEWWASGNANSTVDEACPQANPCTVTELLAAFPNLGIRDTNSAILFKAGSNWAGGFDGNVDNFTIEIAGNIDIYDFEPYLPVHNITQNIKYATIQAGINGANPGDVLEIDPGTYVENVVVNKSITLSGSGDGDNPAVDTILDGTTLTGMGIRLNNNITDVTIEDMRIINYDVTNPSAGIYGNLSNHNLTIQNVTVNGNGPGVVSASGGIVLNGPIDNVLINNVTAHNNWGRGIVIWNGTKTNITITNNDVRNNNCCGIELQDGTASGVTMAGNTVIGNADSGLSAVGLTSGAGPNIISNNIVTDNGRFGIEIKFPNGTGATSGDGSIVVENNTVSLPNPGSDLRDLAGISVYRRGYLVGAGYADIPTGVVVRNNTVSDYRQINGGSFSTGFGIVVEGTKMTVEGNTVTNNDVGIQVQAGHTPYTPNAAGDGNQANLDDDYFGRGNSPIACASVGINTLSSNDIDYRTVGAGANDGAVIHNETSGVYFCTIQQAIDAANPGDTIRVPAGTYVEELVIDKPLSLLGPNDAINPNTGSRVAEAIIQPVNIGTYPIPDTNAACTVLAYLDDSDITVKGFTFDGDNPALNSGVTIGAADVDTCELVAGYGDGGGIVIENNILQNSVYSGIDLANYSNPPTSGNYVRYNLIRNIGEANTSYGAGVITHYNFYADVSHNVFEDVRIGVQTGNYTQPNPGATGGITNNTINAWRLGIFHNAWYSNPSAISVSNNTINAVDSATAPSWTGILISSFQNAADTEINNNTINIGAITQSPAAGYNIWNTPTSAEITINGGIVTGGTYGVWVNNFEGYSSNASNTSIKLDGIEITDAVTAGVYVLDSPSNTNGATVFANIQNSIITNSGTGILVEGGDATAVANFNDIYNNATAGVTNTSGNIMDAENNWWGTNNGPEDLAGTVELPVDPEPAVGDMLNADPTGLLGNSVSDDVDYYPWQSDETAPDTTIDSNPTDPSNSNTAEFTFSGTDDTTDPANLTFECQLDSGGFAACTSPIVYNGLSDGPHTFEVRAIDEMNNVDATPAAYTWVIETATAQTLTFRSQAKNDGWVLESAQGSKKGGSKNNTAKTLRLGDTADKRQYRSILSFNTASLPDDANITSVTLKVKRQTGGITLGGLFVDIRKGAFGKAALQLSDFNAVAHQTLGVFKPSAVNNWYTINLTPAAGNINTTGLTQIRLRFRQTYNNNNVANILALLSGNSVLANRPQLIVEYGP